MLSRAKVSYQKRTSAFPIRYFRKYLFNYERLGSTGANYVRQAFMCTPKGAISSIGGSQKAVTESNLIYRRTVHMAIPVTPFPTPFVVKLLKTLTCCGNAVKSHKGIEAGGCTRQDSCKAKGCKASLAKFFLHPERNKGGKHNSALVLR